MENNKLISMTEFVLNRYNSIMDSPYNDGALTKTDAEIFVKYAKFLSQDITLSMFVPCDDEGNVLEEPESYGWLQNCGSRDYHLTEDDCIECEKYHEAKSKVLFEGFEIETDMHHSTKREIIWLNKPINKVFFRLSFYNGDVKTTFMPDENIKTVEDLLRYNLTLTATALKQIYG